MYVRHETETDKIGFTFILSRVRQPNKYTHCQIEIQDREVDETYCSIKVRSRRLTPTSSPRLSSKSPRAKSTFIELILSAGCLAT